MIQNTFGGGVVLSTLFGKDHIFLISQLESSSSPGHSQLVSFFFKVEITFWG